MAGYTASYSENAKEIMTTRPVGPPNKQYCRDKYNWLHLATNSPKFRLANI
jgi:hypothetical protein